MAKLDIEMPNEFVPKSFSENLDEVCMEAIAAAQPIVVEEMKRQIQAAVKNESTGELVRSIKAGKPQISKYGGYFGTIGPTGGSKIYIHNGKKRPRKTKLSNAAKLIFMEYGTSKQPARPILQKVKSKTEKDVIETMQSVLNRKAGT